MRVGVVAYAPGVASDKRAQANERQVIAVDDAMLAATAGLDAYSHWIVIFETETTEPTQGVCATRGRRKPSGLGVSVVEFLRRDDELLYVRGLHALVGDVVLDVQPYLPQRDAAPMAVTVNGSDTE